MVRIQSNRHKVVNRLRLARDKSLVLVGKQATGFVKVGTPVRSGNARSSITSATNSWQSGPTVEVGEKGKFKGIPVTADLSDTVEQPDEKGIVVIGSNVEYIAHLEYGTATGIKAKYMFRDGILGHKKQLGNTYKKSMKNLMR